MFERFTRDARDVVVRAQSEAAALGHDHIGTEHLLLGVAATNSRAARVLADHGATADALRAPLRAVGDEAALASIGIDLDEVRRRAEASFGPGALDRSRRRRRGHVPFSAPAKKALELALREAIAAGDRHVGAEHILLGLLRDPTTEALLRRSGLDVREIRAALSPAGSRRGRGA